MTLHFLKTKRNALDLKFTFEVADDAIDVFGMQDPKISDNVASIFLWVFSVKEFRNLSDRRRCLRSMLHGVFCKGCERVFGHALSI